MLPAGCLPTFFPSHPLLAASPDRWVRQAMRGHRNAVVLPTCTSCSRTMPERRVQLLAAMLWLSAGGRAAAVPYLRSALQQLLQQSDRHLLE